MPSFPENGPRSAEVAQLRRRDSSNPGKSSGDFKGDMQKHAGNDYMRDMGHCRHCEADTRYLPGMIGYGRDHVELLARIPAPVQTD